MIELMMPNANPLCCFDIAPLTPRFARSVQEAAAALDALATGRVPARAALLSGALSLDTLCNCIVPDRDLMDAAAGLETLVTGRTLDLDAAGRQRAAKLAERVRQVAAMLALAPAPAVQ